MAGEGGERVVAGAIAVHQHERQADAVAGAQGERLARDDVEEREPVARLDERLRAGHAHARPEAPVELDDGDPVEGGRGVLGRRHVGGARDVRDRFEVAVGQRARRAGAQRLVGARERADRLGRLAVGPHLLRRRAQAGAGHGSSRRAAGPGATSTASGGGLAPGGNSPRIAPPKPPPTMRAPGGAGRAEALDGAVDLGHGDLVVVAQARVRGVEERADGREVARVERGDGLVDARVLGEHVADAPVERVREPGGGVRRRRRAASRRRAPRPPPRTRAGGRCSPTRRARARPRSRPSRGASRRGPARRGRRRGCACRGGSRGPRGRRARRVGRAARSARRPSRSRPASTAARGRAGRARRARCGRAGRARGRPRARPTRTARSRAGRRRGCAGRRRRGRGRPAGARRRCRARRRASPRPAPASPTANVSVSPRSSACASMRPAGPSAASTVTPAAIANGRQRPSL